MFKTFSRSLLLSATLLLGVVTPGQAMLILDERASGRHNEKPTWPFIPVKLDNNTKSKECPKQEPNELFWSPASTRIVTK